MRRCYYLTFHSLSLLIPLNVLFLVVTVNRLKLSFIIPHLFECFHTKVQPKKNDYFVATVQISPPMILSLIGRNKKSRADVLRREISCITKKCLNFLF